jgi:hypothetical protein
MIFAARELPVGSFCLGANLSKSLRTVRFTRTTIASFSSLGADIKTMHTQVAT